MRRSALSPMRRLAGLGGTMMAVAVLWLGAQALAQTRGRPTPPAAVPDQNPPAPPAGPRGENFSAKPAPQLFASDCTGAGCHRGPQGLAKGQSPGSLASFLRQHYTNSQQSAAALAAYLAGVPGAPADTRRQKIDRPPHEPTATTKQDPRKKNATAKQPRGKQATVEPAHVPPPAPGAEPPADAAPPPAAAASPPAAAAPPAATAAPTPAPAPAPPKTFDIFD